MFVQEVIDIQHHIIIEYLAQLRFKRFQEVLRGQDTENTEETRRLLPVRISGSDRL